MEKSRFITLMLSFALGIQVACSQNVTPNDYFENVSKEKIYSEILDEERTIYISLPKNSSKSLKYPVLYLLDGEMLEPFKEAFQCIKKNKEIEQHIIIGIETVKNRNRDMIPVKTSSRRGSGGGGKFLQFLTEELQAYVADNYTTNGKNILYGASNAGLFVVFAMLEKPEAFAAYISSSTMIGHCPEFMYKKAEEFNNIQKLNNKRLYMNYGNKNELTKASEFIPAYHKMLEKKFGSVLEIELNEVNNAGHVPSGSLDAGLKFIYDK